MSIDVSLEGKSAIVAGGGRGIGAATSQYLALTGASVAVVDKDPERAQFVANAITTSGGQATAIVADLLQTPDCERIVRETKAAFGSVDIVANVAGGAWAYVPSRRFHNITDDEWDLIFGVNLRYVFLLCREAIKQMLAQGTGGSIVNVSSFAGVFSSPNSSAYGAAKAGLISLSRTMANEYARDGIRVNCVSPGRIETPATAPETMGSADSSDYLETIPMGFVGDPLDIAKAVVFFASDQAHYVTGQMLLVDGGASSNPVIIPSTSTQTKESDGVVRGRP